MKTLYRLILMLLLMLPALNVLAADVDMLLQDHAVTAMDCMAVHKPACHDSKATPAGDKLAARHHGLQCGVPGCSALCAPSLLGNAPLTVAALDASGPLVPHQPARLAGIVITPPHRPPLLV
ncbi:hypothetical protein [Vogesella sp. LIG4]|uniref:hypothetical protein n=1 Tax=Vogesella sp. LIG4 TaxID=1192162 RepID=UPI0008201F58|nr:hypothetical protein [Vogesella sp. LIG4]SCK26116.1 hypothetical protein PSELUDRAFT_3133 [Vogesella sp. LIG4]